MGVLEARENAEVIGFQVVGEEVKDASNVIDYNINGEQTKDAAAEINANNQTTTGMANVIPGINAPKLIAETSIIGGGGGDGGFKAKIVEFTSAMTLAEAQTILDTYLAGYFTIPVLNLSDVAFRYYYPGYMHYNHLVFVFNGENGGRLELKITYSGTTATGMSES